MNIQIIRGHVGRDPEAITFEDNSKKVSFSVATTEYYKNKDGEKKDKTEWHNCVARGRLGEMLLERLAKGMNVLIVGKKFTREYINKKEEKVTIAELFIEEIEILTKTEVKAHADEEQPEQEVKQTPALKKETPKETPSNNIPEFTEDDLPF